MKSFPLALKRPHKITQHGQTRIDDYYWMRNQDDPAVIEYLRAENDYLEEMTGHTKPLQETLFQEMKGRIKETDLTVPEKKGEYYYYTRTEEGKQYPIYCRKHDSLENDEEIILDQNALAEGMAFCRIGAFSVSPDGKKLAYSVDADGKEVCTLYIKDLESGAVYPEQITNTYGEVYDHSGVEWASDNQTIFYITLDPSYRPEKLFRHTLGNDPSADTLIYHEQDETYVLYLLKTRTEAYLMVHLKSTLTTEIRYLPSDDPHGEFRILMPRQDQIEYFAVHHGDRFLITTNEEAQNFKLMETPISDPRRENWREVIPHRDEVMIESIFAFANHLVLVEREKGLQQIRISAPDGISEVKYVPFPEPVYTIEPGKNPEFETNRYRFTYSSLVTPNSVIDFHMDSGEWELMKQDEIPSGHDPEQYISERLYATASDGKQVPISLVYRKGLVKNGANPCLLYGYGSYGYSTDPYFNSNRFSLIDRGFVFVMGHIRGGQELGRAWYDDGKMLNKRNTFTDFIACAEYLIAEGFTCKEKLAIMGGSAGGLLVGACVTMRPDLYKAVIAHVPFVDVVTTMSDPSIPLTTNEYHQWGNPENKTEYEYMMSYSPYDNISKTDYPNLLVTTGLNDPRVCYWEPAKFAAKLRAMKTDENLLVLKTNLDAGHAGASGRYDFLREIALDYAFLIDRLEVAP
jgi:oligopeptidase B